jgi:hypothetical protein
MSPLLFQHYVLVQLERIVLGHQTFSVSRYNTTEKQGIFFGTEEYN